MRARAPGKLLLSGAYAVLEGAPAMVLAVDRHAWAEGRSAQAPAEVRAALSDPPGVDTSALEMDGRKLGLGSSAAGLVAALALRAAESGQDVRDAGVRAQLFAKAWAAHAEVQGGGSGVDIAASVYGGVSQYRTGRPPEAVALPSSLRFAVYFSGQSARTSELRARVTSLSARDPALHRRAMQALIELAERAAVAVTRPESDAGELVTVLQGTAKGLAALGAAADAPIVPPAFAELGELAGHEASAFIPSGAGGGDVGVFVGTEGPSASFVQKAQQLGMKRLELAIDREGVVVLEAA